MILVGSTIAEPGHGAVQLVTTNSPRIALSPATASLAAGSKLSFKASTSGFRQPNLKWMVNGKVGGGPIWGTITQNGVYTAPAINPGAAVTVSAASSSNILINGNATLTVVNPPTPELTGATYAAEVASWEAQVMPEVVNSSGLQWDSDARTWNPQPDWIAPSTGTGPLNYYKEQFLRPLTRLAIAKGDIPLMEELAEFHLALLQWRTTTVGNMLQYGESDAEDYIDGPPTARTFPWYDNDGDTTTIVVREDIQSDAQYLSTAAQLLRAIAQMPAAKRTAPLLQFVQGYSGFLASEQLLRILYGTVPNWFYGNPNIPLPLVAGWTFLAQTGYRPPHPYTYQAAMTDTMLWLVADSAEVLGADAAAPNLAILNNTTRPQLKQAVLAGVSLMQARCPHLVSPDGADVLSLFAGEYDDHPSYAYAATPAPASPAHPTPSTG